MRLPLVLLFAVLLALPLAAATFESHDGTTLHYDVVGKGTPVVLLSGGPGFSPDYLEPLADGLRGKSGDRSFVLLHQRGTGRSTVAKYDAATMGLKTLVGDLEALRKELGLERLTIVGHSFGGILSMMYVREHPDRVAALALVDSGGPTLASVAKFASNLEARFTDEEKALIRTWSAPAKVAEDRKRAVLELTKAKTPAYFADRTKAKPLVDAMDESSFNDAAFWAIAQQMMVLDLREGLEKLKAPVLVVHGRQDPLESAEEVHAAFPGSKLTYIDDAGHFPWIEQPDAFFAVVGEFLRSAR
jgi:proline iminopeptidase